MHVNVCVCVVPMTISLCFALACAVLFANERLRERAECVFILSPGFTARKRWRLMYFSGIVPQSKRLLWPFLMRHVNFIKRGAEESQREQLQLWKA